MATEQQGEGTSKPNRLDRRLDAQDKMLKEIRMALVGDSALGHRGLVTRMETIENDLKGRAYKSDVIVLKDKVEKHDRKLWVFQLGATAVWSGILLFFKETLKR